MDEALVSSLEVTALIGRRIDDQYRIVRAIGHGGMGAVYEALNDETRHRAAVKVLYPNFSRDRRLVERLFLEAQAVNIVNHPGLVRIYRCGHLSAPHLGDTAYILMEYLEGESLWQRMCRLIEHGERFPLSGALRICRQVASALAAVHEKGIIHRDLKPANVFIVADPEVPSGERAKLLDFGVAKFQHGSPTSRRTTADRVLGTPIYMSPEQCRGATLTGKSDVYALGVMLYELLAGQPPFNHEEVGVLMAMHMRDEPPRLRDLRADLPGDVVALIEAMLGKDAAQRPAMVEVEALLETLEAPAHEPSRGSPTVPEGPRLAPMEPPVQVLPPQPLSSDLLRPPARRGPALVVAALVAALVGAALGLLALRPGHRTTAGRPAPAVAPPAAAAPVPAAVIDRPALPAPSPPPPEVGPGGEPPRRKPRGAARGRQAGPAPPSDAAPRPDGLPPRLDIPEIKGLSPPAPGR